MQAVVFRLVADWKPIESMNDAAALEWAWIQQIPESFYVHPKLLTFFFSISKDSIRIQQNTVLANILNHIWLHVLLKVATRY